MVVINTNLNFDFGFRNLQRFKEMLTGIFSMFRTSLESLNTESTMYIDTLK